MDKAIGGSAAATREARLRARKGRTADAAERAMAGVAARILGRGLADRYLEVVRDTVDRAQRHERDGTRQRTAEQRQSDLQRDRRDTQPGAELSHPLSMMPRAGDLFHAQRARKPESTGSVMPVMQRAAGVQR